MGQEVNRLKLPTPKLQLPSNRPDWELGIRSSASIGIRFHEEWSWSRITLLPSASFLTLSQAGTFTQGDSRQQVATDITAADVQAVINAPTGGGDRQMKVVDMGRYNVSVGVLRRGKTKPGAPVGAINHEHVTEVYTSSRAPGRC